jgi:hypothetical protein
MFNKKDIAFFLSAGVLVAAGYACMLLDPSPHGLGPLTQWIAPNLLIIGFIVPVFGIIGLNNVSLKFVTSSWKTSPLKHGFAAIAFLTSFVVYISTLEPTASLWDCAEFIACAYKLEVPHTPGTPLALLIGKLFSMLSFGHPSSVAWQLNMMSALFSALTIYVLFHIIYFLGEKHISKSHHSLLLSLAAAGGSLCLAFSDSFWFSAVEAEIYGMACFFMMLIFWLMLKGNTSTEPFRSRMLILITYMAGLSYCIHPMCLLVIPVLLIVWYRRDHQVSIKRIFISALGGMMIVFLINRFIAIGLFELAFNLDLFFVNSLHFPFYSGAIFLVCAMVIIFMILLKRFKNYAGIMWSVLFLILGFLPYGILFIRSNQDPPIDENNPENLAMIKAYMNRESYPTSPLLYGTYFDARIDAVGTKRQAYYKDSSEYAVAGNIPEYQYERSRQTFLPRLHSHDPDHAPLYRAWTGLKSNESPKFIDNLTFMFEYQFAHMYLRYLLWNFAGRESEIQDSGWLKPWDSLSSPDHNLARNQYWMIPLLLGILGACYHFRTDKKSFYANLFFFLITGIILALYLNSPPSEPRERDYIYVGSYIAFSLWIGLGIVSISAMPIRKPYHWIIIFFVSTSIPAWMAFQNYDDHDRSGRTLQVENAKLTLNSCAPHAILFTGGDNDTFPLWYAQEVEGIRTDVRVVVLSYFNTDWYINQLRNHYYESKPFHLTLGEKDYRQYGPNDALYVEEQIKGAIDVKQYLTLLKEEHPALVVMGMGDDPYHIVPSKNLSIKTELADFRKISLQAPEHASVTKEMNIRVKGNYLEKNALALLDLIISNHWERPIYFNFTSMNTLSINLKPYLVQEGIVSRLLPVVNENQEPLINTTLSYNNLLNKGDYSNLSDPEVNFSYEHHHLRMIVPIRHAFNELAAAYLRNNDTEHAEKILQEAVAKLYPSHLKASYTNLYAADMLLALGKDDLARTLAKSGFDYFYGLVSEAQHRHQRVDEADQYFLTELAAVLHRTGDTTYSKRMEELGLAMRD